MVRLPLQTRRNGKCSTVMVYSGKMPGEIRCVPLPLWRMDCSFLLDGFRLGLVVGWLFFCLLVCWLIVCCCRISPCGRPAYSAGPKQVTDLHRACGSLPCGCFFCLGYHKKSRRRKSLIRLCIMQLWKESVIFLRIPWQEFREVPLPIPPFSPRLFQDRQEDQVRPYWQCHAAEEDSSPCR